jgi:Lecithin retinol acyltransferase
MKPPPPPDKLFAKENGTIRLETLEVFARGLSVEVRAYESSLDSDQVIARALSRLGERGYDLVENNCEHFAIWSKTGHHHSPQVWTANRIVQRTAAVAARVGMSRATRIAMRGLSRGAMPWLLAAEGVQLATELAAAKVNPHAPEEVEKLGRRVGLVTAIGVGALAGAGTWVAGDQAGQHAAEWVKRRLQRPARHRNG